MSPPALNNHHQNKNGDPVLCSGCHKTTRPPDWGNFFPRRTAQCPYCAQIRISTQGPETTKLKKHERLPTRGIPPHERKIRWTLHHKWITGECCDTGCFFCQSNWYPNRLFVSGSSWSSSLHVNKMPHNQPNLYAGFDDLVHDTLPKLLRKDGAIRRRHSEHPKIPKHMCKKPVRLIPAEIWRNRGEPLGSRINGIYSFGARNSWTFLV